MSDLVARLRLEADGGDQAAAEPAKVEAALEAVGPAGAAADRGARQAAAGMSVLGNAANGTVRHLQAVSAGGDGYVAGSTQVVSASNKVQAAARLQSHEWLNLTRNFADVGVQAAALQNPFMILIQQGPQIADVFQTAKMRGVGFKDVMAEIAGVAGPLLLGGGILAIAAGTVFALGKAFLDGEREAAAFNNALAVTGNYAGLTADSFVEMADRITAANDSAIGDTKALLSQAVASGRLQGETLELAVQNAQKYAQLTGRSAESFLQSYEQMKSGVAKFGAEHAQQYHSLTLAQLKHIELLEKEGRTSEAQLQLMKDVAAGVGDLQANYGTLERALIGVRNAASDMWDKLLGIGRQKSTGDQLGEAQNKLRQLNSPYHNDLVKLGGAQGEAVLLDRRATEQRIGVLEMLVKGQEKAAADRAASAAKESDRIARYFSPSSKPRQPAAAPRDMSDERTSQVEALLAQARQEELNARLSLSRDVATRASIQKQILQAELVEKSAGIDRQIANIEHDVAQKRLTAAKGQELVEQLLIVQAIQGRTTAQKQQAVADEAAAELAREAAAQAQASLTNQIDLLAGQADLTQSTFARNVIEARILELQQQIERSKLEEVVNSADSSAQEVARARDRLAVLDQIHAQQKAQLAQQVRLVDALTEAADAVRGFKNAWRSKDWAGLFDNLARTIQTVEAAWAAKGPAGGMMVAGSAAAALIGGKTGSAIGSGLGIAGLGASMGGMLAGGLSGTVGAIGGSLGISMAAQVGAVNAIAGLAPMLGPIGLAAGALYAAAKIFNLGGKPTNAGAGVNLISGEISGNKRTTETENAAKSVADAVLQGMKVLQGAGISSATSVNSLVLGTRDTTKIHLSDGRTVESAVGNAAAAVDAAMRAVLQGATYTSETQKKLVESAIAAGKGFDEVAAILDSFSQAQSLVKGIDDAILQLTDPKAWAVEELKRAQEAQRDAFKAAADSGYLTADEYAKALVKLDTLEGLQLAETLKRFQDSVEETADALKDRAKTLGQSVNDRLLELTNPTAFGLKRINDEIDAKIAEANPLITAGELGADFLAVLEELRQLEIGAFLGNLADEVDETAKAFQDARPRLLSWLDQLRVGGVAELSPKAQREEAMRQYQRQLALAQGGDKDALANITAYADRLLEADKAATSSASARLALRNQVSGQVEGLAARGAEQSPAAAIASLQPTLAQIAAAGAAELATITAGGKSVVISNLPSMQAMYGDLIGKQTDRLVAANDRTREEMVQATTASAARLEAALAALAGSLEGVAAQAAAASAEQAAQLSAELRELSTQQRLTDALARAAR